MLLDYFIIIFLSVYVGLGKVNEKLKSCDDLFASDFELFNEEAPLDKNEEDILHFKTPVLIKSFSNINTDSPSLFSPLSEDCELHKGTVIFNNLG